ncbi:MAG: ribbon-helix-helix protein, CopG family [Defluviitaleaceae bacterium]|nr:ribbon-helix-helix protein, CopG family [Defluviitaleaceae bacterium]MCL2275034.1 ribbon-helix-helix protein, CopG family [Defluviitaleaceae bacterium]
MKTEKVSVNLSPTELGQIDLLVERGVFDNRSDFMRAAARKSLESYEETFLQFLQPKHMFSSSKTTLMQSVGVVNLSKSYVTQLIEQNEKLHIRVIGVLKVADNITHEEIEKVVQTCKIHGKIIASDAVKVFLLDAEER